MSDAVFLTLNAGSSSVKFAVYAAGADPVEIARGQIENLGDTARLKMSGDGIDPCREDIGKADHNTAMVAILDHLGPVLNGRAVTGVGHRIVHGGDHYAAPQVLDEDTLRTLATFSPLAPLHQPFNLAGVRAAIEAFPNAVQVGCFDTAFHRGHERRFDEFGLPRAFFDAGVRRYGFHGLSYTNIADQLRRDFPKLVAGRVIVAHLGNGASMCAMVGGQSVSTTMGFSALDGLVMGTRPGALDAGVMLYLMTDRGMDARALSNMLYRDCGLLGLSGISHDMRTLLDSDDPAAAQAIDTYVTRIRHEIGGMAADMGGLDALVFTGGIGENASPIRQKVCDGMGWLGVHLNHAANAKGQADIGAGRVRVLAMKTDEERVIARAVKGVVDS